MAVLGIACRFYRGGRVQTVRDLRGWGNIGNTVQALYAYGTVAATSRPDEVRKIRFTGHDRYYFTVEERSGVVIKVDVAQITLPSSAYHDEGGVLGQWWTWELDQQPTSQLIHRATFPAWMTTTEYRDGSLIPDEDFRAMHELGWTEW